MYKLNPFVRKYERNDIVALYNSLSLSTIYFKKDEFHKAIKKPTEALKSNDFIVDVDFNSIDYFKKQYEKTKINNEISLAYFLVTSTCNLACEYCFVESRFAEPTNSVMTKEIAKKGIKVLQNNTKNSKIIFYGGEPFLNFPIIKFIVNELNNSKINVRYSVVTNGSVMTKEIMRFIKDNNISLSISLDGLKEVNDSARKFHNGKGSYDKIIRTLDNLKEEEIQFGISCTIGQHNFESPEKIIQILDRYNIRGFGYNLLSENENVRLTEIEYKAMVENILLAEDKVIENRLVEDRIINRKLKPFVEKKNWTRDCAGYGKQIVITPKGEVGVCHGLWPDLVNKDVKHYFDIDVDYSGQIKDHPTWKEWFNRTPFNMPQCWNCVGIGLCGGGCAKNSLLRKGDIWEIDDDICILTKESIPWVIWKYYDIKNNNDKQTVPNKS